MAAPKKVSWAPEGDLRQLRFFSLGDAPALSGLQARGQIQVKSSLPHQSTKMDSNLVPPGRESPHSVYQGKRSTLNLPVITWKQPLKFILNTDWLVAEGGASEEFGVQNERQRGNSEAIYSLSSIPPDPSVAPEAKIFCYDDAQTPLIPITEVDNEEPDASILENPNSILDTPSSGSQPHSLNLGNHQEHTKGSSIQTVENPLTKNSILKISVAEPDVEAAASAAYTAIRVISARGSLIDRELLVKILSNPKVIEKLAAECAVPKQATPSASSMLSTSAVPAVPSSTEVPVLPFSSGAQASALPPSNEVGPAKLLHVPIQQSPTCSHSAPSVISHFKPQVSCASMHQTAKTVAETPSKDLSYYKSLIRQHGAQDANYYKSLIQQHGGGKKDATDRNIPCTSEFQDHFLNSLQRVHVESKKLDLRQTDTKSRIQKPCVFFGSPKGCKRGVNCLFQHGYSQSFPPNRPGEKRSKLDKRIT